MLRRVTVLALAALALRTAQRRAIRSDRRHRQRGDAVAAHSRHGRGRDPQGRDREGAGLRTGERRAQRAGHRPDDLSVRLARQAVHRHRGDAAGRGRPAVADRSDREVLRRRLRRRGATSPCATCSRTRPAFPTTTTACSTTARTTPKTSWSSSRRRCRSTSRPARSGSTATPATSCSARSCARCRDRSTATCFAIACSRRSA